MKNWRRGYGQKYNHLVIRTESGFAGTRIHHFACGAKSEYIQYDHEDYHNSRCQKCLKRIALAGGKGEGCS